MPFWNAVCHKGTLGPGEVSSLGHSTSTVLGLGEGVGREHPNSPATSAPAPPARKVRLSICIGYHEVRRSAVTQLCFWAQQHGRPDGSGPGFRPPQDNEVPLRPDDLCGQGGCAEPDGEFLDPAREVISRLVLDEHVRGVLGDHDIAQHE